MYFMGKLSVGVVGVCKKLQFKVNFFLQPISGFDAHLLGARESCRSILRSGILMNRGAENIRDLISVLL